MQNFMENPVKLKAYRIYIYLLEQKVLLNIQLGVICMDMVDFADLVTIMILLWFFVFT